MLVSGNLRKMKGLLASPIEYFFRVDEQEIPLNKRIGQRFRLQFMGNIFCVQCGRKTSKSFQQGHCFPCMRRLNECGNCIIHPEKCLVEQGGCLTDDWAHAHCDQSHIVYLANTSGLKVGITRLTQLPTRWIDQGASQAMPIFQVSNRYQAGLIEVAMKAYVADKTNWRTMLKQVAPDLDLVFKRDGLLQQAHAKLDELQQQYQQKIRKMNDGVVQQLEYPVTVYPEKVSSVSLDKTPLLEATLLGIKGQYLMLDCGVINIRKFSGYQVELEFLNE